MKLQACSKIVSLVVLGFTLTSGVAYYAVDDLEKTLIEQTHNKLNSQLTSFGHESALYSKRVNDEYYDLVNTSLTQILALDSQYYKLDPLLAFYQANLRQPSAYSSGEELESALDALQYYRIPFVVYDFTTQKLSVHNTQDKKQEERLLKIHDKDDKPLPDLISQKPYFGQSFSIMYFGSGTYLCLKIYDAKLQRNYFVLSSYLTTLENIKLDVKNIFSDLTPLMHKILGEQAAMIVRRNATIFKTDNFNLNLELKDLDLKNLLGSSLVDTQGHILHDFSEIKDQEQTYLLSVTPLKSINSYMLMQTPYNFDLSKHQNYWIFKSVAAGSGVVFAILLIYLVLRLRRSIKYQQQNLNNFADNIGGLTFQNYISLYDKARAEAHKQLTDYQISKAQAREAALAEAKAKLLSKLVQEKAAQSATKSQAAALQSPTQQSVADVENLKADASELVNAQSNLQADSSMQASSSNLEQAQNAKNAENLEYTPISTDDSLAKSSDGDNTSSVTNNVAQAAQHHTSKQQSNSKPNELENEGYSALAANFNPQTSLQNNDNESPQLTSDELANAENADAQVKSGVESSDKDAATTSSFKSSKAKRKERRKNRKNRNNAVNAEPTEEFEVAKTSISTISQTDTAAENAVSSALVSSNIESIPENAIRTDVLPPPSATEPVPAQDGPNLDEINLETTTIADLMALHAATTGETSALSETASKSISDTPADAQANDASTVANMEAAVTNSGSVGNLDTLGKSGSLGNLGSSAVSTETSASALRGSYSTPQNFSGSIAQASNGVSTDSQESSDNLPSSEQKIAELSSDPALMEELLSQIDPAELEAMIDPALLNDNEPVMNEQELTTELMLQAFLKRLPQDSKESSRTPSNVESQILTSLFKVVSGLNAEYTTKTEQAIEQAKVELKSRIPVYRKEGKCIATRQMLMSALPDENAMPESNFVDFAAFTVPARDLSGNFYTLKRIDEDNLVFIIGDCDSTGVQAAYTVAVVTTLLQEALKLLLSPCEILSYINQRLCAAAHVSPVALFVGIISEKTGNVIAANAGHCVPLLLDDQGPHFVDQTASDKLGINPDQTYTQIKWYLANDDMVILYSQGILNVKNADDQIFGMQRLLDHCTGSNNLHADEMVIKILNDIKEHKGKRPFRQDVSLICLKQLLIRF